MALFTDAEIVTLDDLVQFETALVQVASSHGINVDTKIQLATNAISDRLMLWLLNVGASDPQWLNRRFFAEAYNVQLNTRFQGKWTEYQTAAKDAAEMVFMSGIGIVYNALPKPAMPLVAVETGTVSPQALYIQTAWTDSHANEGALSPVNGVILNGDSSITVSMSEGALRAPAAATGWNLYAGTADSDMTRQNNAPLAIGLTWLLPSTGLIDGPRPVNGQEPNFYIPLSRPIQRG
jgi:hypothetical protein